MHTPGPWRTFERPTGIEILCGDRHPPNRMPSAGIRVADVRFKRIGRGGSFARGKTDEANARLIAAAPDLKAFAESILIYTIEGAEDLLWLRIGKYPAVSFRANSAEATTLLGLEAARGAALAKAHPTKREG